jgi:M6 family metalloprotease-like protein
MKIIYSFLLFFCIHLVSYGVYLENVPYQLQQPDGEMLNVFITGDEFYRRIHDSEGYSIVQGNDGWYYYAIYDLVSDELVPSEYIVSASRATALPMAKRLGISREKYMAKRYAYYEPTDCDLSGASNNSILQTLANNNSKVTTTMNNIIICIGFSDTEEMTYSYDSVDGMFNSNPDNNLSNYYSTMSYGKIDIISHFYPPADGTVLRFYKDSNPRSYYQQVSPSNPIGYVSGAQHIAREHTLLKDAVMWVNQNYPIPFNINLDINNDGFCDYITFIVFGPVAGWSDLLWPHKWSLFSYDVKINGKSIYDYNFELDGTYSYFNVGVFCHEGYHQLGAPDLYHYNDEYGSLSAVGPYDLMENTNNLKPQSMSAYMKWKYGNWIPSLPIANINQTYEVYPFYTNDGTNINKPVIHRIPMTNTTSQYSVVEYRKKNGMNYDSSLPNEGLVIYRINSDAIGNASFTGGTPDEVYLYRPGSSQSPGSGIYTQGILFQAPFNNTNKRTEFNSTTDPKPCQSHGIPETILNINHILYDSISDSYTFFYGDPTNMSMFLNKDELILGKQAGAPGAVLVISNVLWHVSIPENAATWLTASKTRGMNKEKIVFSTLSENNTGAIRSTQVIFWGNDTTFLVNVIQDIVETYCEETVSNLEVNIDVDSQLAKLIWDAPQEKTKNKLPKQILWNNTAGETNVGFQSSRWIGGNDRIVLADDFNVPKDETWTLEEISFTGWTNGSSPLPTHIGIAIYKDNGKDCPQNTPIYEKADFTPIEGIISGEMHISLIDPIVIGESGKYWISIYGIYEEKYDYTKRFDLASTTKTIGAKMCRWDPSGILGDPHYFPNWGVVLIDNPLYYGFSFSLFGVLDYSDKILYNVYVDDILVAAEVEKTTYEYSKQIIISEDHNWCVATLCTSYIESEKICYQTQGLRYNISVSVNPSIGGTVVGEGIYGHGENVTLTAIPNVEYVFVNWVANGIAVSTAQTFSFKATEDVSFVAHFRKAQFLDFDIYAVTKWNNTFMLNLKKLSEDSYDITTCIWFKNGVKIGEGFAYSAGNQSTDLLEVGAIYSFELHTAHQDTLISTPKVFSIQYSNLKIYPNPLPQGNALTIEDCVQGDKIEVFNNNGACIYQTTAPASKTELPLAVPSGVYIVRVNNKEFKVLIN